MTGKMTFTQFVIATGLGTLLVPALFGGFGSIVHYLYTIVKEDDVKYSHGMLITFFIFGVFVAILAHFLMMDFFGTSYEGVLLLSGFLVLRILDFLDVSGLDIVLRRVGVKKEELEKVAHSEGPTSDIDK